MRGCEIKISDEDNDQLLSTLVSKIDIKHWTIKVKTDYRGFGGIPCVHDVLKNWTMMSMFLPIFSDQFLETIV